MILEILILITVLIIAGVMIFLGVKMPSYIDEIKDKIDSVRSSVENQVNDSVKNIKGDVQKYCSKGFM
jgi:sensor domain CHASE-containing protein